MLQPLFKTVGSPKDRESEDMSDAKPPGLAERLDAERLAAERRDAERLEAEFPVGVRLAAKPQPTASSMAERFAPQTLRATREETPDIETTDPKPASLAPRLFTAPRQGVLAVLTGVAIAPAAILAGLLWFGAIRGPDVGSDAGSSADNQPGSHQAAVAAAPALRVKPQSHEIGLTSPEEVVANAGDNVAFAIGIEAKAVPARSVIAIRDLPDGAAFSKGRPFGSREWSLTPDETAGLKLHLPEDHAGTSDLAVELVAADGTVLARTATRLDVAPSPTAGIVVRSGEEDRINDLIAHGHKMIAVGYFAGARAYYQRAAEAGSGEAALAVGATYDPAFIAALRVQGIKPDREAAEEWYGRAAALGVVDRAGKLAMLRQTWLNAGADPEGNTPPAPAADPAPAERADSTSRAEGERGPFGRLVAAASELAGGEEWVVVANPVNVRKGPSSTDETFKVAQKGTRLRVLGRDGNWVQITDPATKQEGWIYKRFLKETAAP